jgi:Domain of Unknown Function (DUF1080)
MKIAKLFLFMGILVFMSCKDNTKTTTSAPPPPPAPEMPKGVAATLSEAETAAGFKLLFNGLNTEGWHVYRKDSATHWQIAEGVLFTKGGHNDLVTDAEYENFEFMFDWKVGKGGNSGVLYMVQDDPATIKETYYSGIEYQVIDDLGWDGKLEDAQKPGAAYDLYPPKVAAANPAGEWNTGKIVCNKGRIQHYVNDKMTADYIWNSDDYKKRFAKSKFKDWPFGKKSKGHIAFQDHGQEVSYRNIRIKQL